MLFASNRKRFSPIIKWIFTPCTENLLLFVLNRETKVKGNFICVSVVSPRRAEPGDQNLSKRRVCSASSEAGHMPESCAPGRAVPLAALPKGCEGKDLGVAHGWIGKVGEIDSKDLCL